LEKIKHGFKTLAECGGVDDTSSFLNLFIYQFLIVCFVLVAIIQNE
jgi:hypothetical protein